MTVHPVSDGDHVPDDPDNSDNTAALAVNFTRRYHSDWRYVANWGKWLMGWPALEDRGNSRGHGLDSSRMPSRSCPGRESQGREKIKQEGSIVAVLQFDKTE